MGSLMAGWDSPIRDAKQVRLHFNNSMTREEIANYWRAKRIIEEEHLLSAFKSAARIKARTFTAEDYKRFEDSLAEDEKPQMKNTSYKDEETRIGIKDWWTKSNYAYLNQPPLTTIEPAKPKYKYTAQFDIAYLVKARNDSETGFNANPLRVF
uniref:Uncharacterized protein n=1 Tax=Picea sitchensis TaxID=3332 RepID=A9NTS3_PICSI|nr:unknown [Picea sitchensis]